MEYRFYNLLREFTLTDFKLKYHGSILGYFWSLLNPLLMFGVLYVVFSLFVRFEQEHYALYLLLGIILWGYFAEATVNAMQALLGKARIIKNVYFPRVIVVLASNLTAFLGLLLNLVVFFALFLFSGASLNFWVLWIFFYLTLLFVLTFGFSLVLAALNLRFPDVQHLWRILLQLLFWATPIVYPVSLVPEGLRKFFLFNPLFLVIEDSRNAVIYSQTFVGLHFVILFVFSLFILVIGYLIHARMAEKFPEWV